MKRCQRWVLDTNIAVSAFLWSGNSSQVFVAVIEQEIELFSSRTLLGELASTLLKPKLAKYVVATGMTANQLSQSYRQLVTAVAVKPLPAPICRDPDDDNVLACALSAKADLIVSGNKDLLVIGSFDGIPILTVAQALKRLGRSTL